MSHSDLQISRPNHEFLSPEIIESRAHKLIHELTIANASNDLHKMKMCLLRNIGHPPWLLNETYELLKRRIALSDLGKTLNKLRNEMEDLTLNILERDRTWKLTMWLNPKKIPGPIFEKSQTPERTS